MITLNPSKKPIVIWLFSGCFLILAMVVIGGITRLTNSGLSMVEWNVVMGFIPPLSEQAWQQEFAKYQQSPEFQLVNSSFTLHDFKTIFWWEYIHRLLGRIIGIVFIIPFLYFYFKKRLEPSLIRKLVIMFFLGGFQGFLGWYMVKSGLVKDPHVSHYRLAIHLITAFLVCGYIFWVALGMIRKTRYPLFSGIYKIRKWSFWLMLITIVQIIFGAFVAGLDAGRIYNTFPLMEGRLIPETVTYTFSKTGISSLVDNPGSVQFMHRMIAYILSVLILWFYIKTMQFQLPNMLKRSLNYILVILFTQVILGILTVMYAVPVWLGVVHQLMAFLLFMSWIYTHHLLWRRIR